METVIIFMVSCIFVLLLSLVIASLQIVMEDKEIEKIKAEGMKAKYLHRLEVLNEIQKDCTEEDRIRYLQNLFDMDEQLSAESFVNLDKKTNRSNDDENE